MVARGFANDNESRTPAVSNEGRRKAIAKVMARGGIVRRTLTANSVEIDPASWRGKPGIEIVEALVTAVEAIEKLPEKTLERIMQLSSRLADVGIKCQTDQLDDHDQVS